MIKIGHGIDVHAFIDRGLPEQFVTFGGVKIPHAKSILAHSDGDVLLHALADALLGALALGDIGEHFPDTSDDNKDLDSRIILRHAYALVKQHGYQIVNADMTIICERPKVLPHKDAMRANIAADLQTDITNISIKATTNEKMGHLGRGEGVQAHAVVLLAKQ
ncbi:2-C-methyl-D-erythritol 2,4-cyclodiphosphate synthase [Moraxella caviae]|uniref:2-C-methyl-D-erythritol 2,4-cyclodiphosphate synthase n=1 Tax=Moraxella caviae TaxID=34060 RepID=A0A1S9ZUL0_9GAMM|nr:2-C-methyl-D-erythritol 2,4-cyclodiphosphate synthase [Moraxella caviae]OOR87140.1 2-C-methyl-D-erythritol 2,4-cyclodiphosphate synthase [Moraxella caviae]STZ14783.1 2-C-methyl-D-erythritol 2,4-cyclodiphosphate synthase [Moraxella caviae]